MTLLDRITTDLNVDEPTALDGLRPLFMVIKLAVSKKAFDKLAHAVPTAEQWCREATHGSPGRTGELVALITPETLALRLGSVGFDKSQIDKLGASMGQFLSETFDPDVAVEIAERIPFVELNLTAT